MSLKILGVLGSMRESSQSGRALAAVLEAARKHGADPRLLSLREADLPMYNPDSADGDPRVTTVAKLVAWADAFVLASPDYHGSMSGVLKNFLDYHWSEFAGKLFAFLCASHEKGLTAMDQMRTAVVHCYGWSLPYGISIDGRTDFDAEGKIRNPRLESRMNMVARDLVTYGSLLRNQFQADVTARAADTFAARYA